jgi:predicted TPR repeat methyltransferase
MSFDFALAEFDLYAPLYDKMVEELGFTTVHKEVLAASYRHIPSDIFKAIDLGTGTGILLPSLAAHFKQASLIGTDFSPVMLEKAREKGVPAVLVQADLRIEEWPFEKNSFQLATISGVLEFIEKPELFIQNTAQILVAEGVAIATYQTPQHGKTPIGKGAAPSYSHSARRMEDAFTKAGMQIKEHSTFEAYKYYGQPITYGIIAAQKIVSP